MNMRKLGVLVAVLVSLVGSAQAQDLAATTSTDTASPATESGKKISAALFLGYTPHLNSGGNAYGFGFGARGGYLVTNEIYVGAKLQYNLGDSLLSSFMFGIEGGYEVPVADKLVIRPQLGLGIASVSVDDITVSGFTVPGGSTTEFYLEPGAVLQYDVAQDIFVGGQLSIPLILGSSTASGLSIMVTGGMRF